jgi:hypothetical protein
MYMRHDAAAAGAGHICIVKAESDYGVAVWLQGKSPTSLTFYQARDGCLHAMYGAEPGLQHA